MRLFQNSGVPPSYLSRRQGFEDATTFKVQIADYFPVGVAKELRESGFPLLSIVDIG